MFRLPWKAKGGISFFSDLLIGHHLNNLGRFRQDECCGWWFRHSSIHQGRLAMKLVEQRIFERIDLIASIYRVCPDPRDLPDVDLSIGDNI